MSSLEIPTLFSFLIVIHEFDGLDCSCWRKSFRVCWKIKNSVKNTPVILKKITDSDSYFTEKNNRIYLQDVKNHAQQGSLQHSSRNVFRIRDTAPKPQYHLSFLQVGHQQPQQPCWNLHCYKYSQGNVVVTALVERDHQQHGG